MCMRVCLCVSVQVNAARLLFERAAHARDAKDSFRVFNLVRSLRYLVVSTVQVRHVNV